MLKVTGDKVYLTRGDTGFLKLSILDDVGDTFTPSEGDKVIFRLKKTTTSERLLIEKEVNLDTMVLSFDEDDTKHMSFGIYRYEIEVVTNLGQHFTVIENSEFEIGAELEVHSET